MKNFIKELVTNRSGIVMATLNICYFFFSKNYFSAFSKNCEENYLLCDKTNFYWMSFYCVKLMDSINSVIIDMTMSLYRSLHKFTNFSDSTDFQIQIQIFTFLFLMVFQWLFIGWIAKNVAQAIRPN